MAGKRSTTAIISLGALSVLVASASASSPDVAAMNLQSADVPGANLVAQAAVTEKGYAAANTRTFRFAIPGGSSRLVLVKTETKLASTASVATADVGLDEKSFRSPTGRRLFIAAIANAAKVKPAAVAVGPLRKAAGYDQGFTMSLSFPVKRTRVYETLAYLRLDRVAVSLLEVGLRPITAGATRTYFTALAGHIGTQLAPISASPPTVTGAAQQGQTLTGAPGTWTATDATFTYQWQRCDAAGTNCVNVPGATAQTYVVTSADAAATLVVVVTAANRFGVQTAPSAATQVVS